MNSKEKYKKPILRPHVSKNTESDLTPITSKKRATELKYEVRF